MIEVRITGSEIVEHTRNSADPFIINELKKAGIPMVDTLSLRGVTRGKLSWFQDHWGTDMIFRWEE